MNPSVYFNPTAQQTSITPAITRRNQATFVLWPSFVLCPSVLKSIHRMTSRIAISLMAVALASAAQFSTGKTRGIRSRPSPSKCSATFNVRPVKRCMSKR